MQLSKDGCSVRQARLVRLLERRKLDLVVLTDWRDVYYFTGAFSEIPYPRALVVRALVVDSGPRATLLAETEYPEAVADRTETYALQTFCTLNFDPHLRLTRLVGENLPRARRIGVQQESLLAATAHTLLEVAGGAELVEIDDDLLRMQAIKDEDEISLLRRANQLNDVGYEAVRGAIREGVTEAEVLAAGKAAVTAAAGCDLFYSGDFRCAAPGGFATDRRCRAGELYIVDAWVYYGGYWSDNCRTFPVTGLDDRQRRAWEKTEQTVLAAEAVVRPGVSCRQVFESMKQMQDEIKPGALFHHGGHGTGLRPHGYPRINPHFDDVFQAGNVITLEPGVYGDDLRGGIRLECNYLVTDRGLERLNRFPISIPA